MEKIIIIGAGIAGLTTGIYARLNGYNTEIHESHSIPGGECTAWKRGEYTFDGCIHWLMGSKPGTAFNRIWQETGALDDSVRVINNEEFSRLEMGGRSAAIYRSIDRTEKQFLEMFPQDADAIREMFRAARAMKHMEMPIDKPMDAMGLKDGLKLAAKMMPIMGEMNKYGKMTITEFAGRFHDPLLRALMLNLMPGYCAANALLMVMGSLDNGDSGYPEGGSLPFARRMEKRYLALGGNVFYKSKVGSILVEGGRAVGVRLSDGTERRADWVISCADGRATLDRMLDGKFLDKTMEAMYADSKAYPVYTTVQVTIGVAADLSSRPSMMTVEAGTPVDSGGIINHLVGLKNYSFDKTLSPAGKTVVMSLLTADFDWWKAKKADPAAYRAEKERLAREVCSVLEARYPETKGKIEMVDVVTPMTYVRYCDAWRGSWMSFMSTPKSSVRYLPGNLPGLDRFYMAGQWTLPPGGLPGAAMAGRFVIQRLCMDAKQEFVTK